MDTVTQLAVIGAGVWGQNLIRVFNALGALSAVCDLKEERRNEVKELYPNVAICGSVDEVLQDEQIGAVAIATPAESHGGLVKRALLAGKDVFVEKPLCLSVSTAEMLVTLARDRGRILMVGHLLWYHPAILKLKELVDSGELGRIQYIYSHRLNIGRIRREESILWSFAPHDVSVILGLLGEMPESVQGQGGNYLHKRIADVTVSLLSFPSGVKAHIFVSWLHPFKEQKLIIVGDRRMAVFDDLKAEEKLLLFPHSIDWQNNIPVVHRAEAQVVSIQTGEPLLLECEHFLERLRSRARPVTDGEEGLRVLRVLQDCEDALKGNTDKHKLGVRSQGNHFVHETAFVDDGAEIGAGTTIWHFSHVMANSRLGKNCRIGQNVVIGRDVRIGNGVKVQNNVSVYEGVTLEDHVFCGPSMVFTNVFNPRSEIPRKHEFRSTLVRRGATLGANCTIICGVTIGQYAFVGAGAVVTRDVPDYALVVGNPARVTGWMCECGTSLNTEGSIATCPACFKKYRHEEKSLSLIQSSLNHGQLTANELQLD